MTANNLLGSEFSAYPHNSIPKAPALKTILEDSHREGLAVKPEVEY
jgi:hypothetical protein